MNKIFIDTGGWVGLFNKRDKFHQGASQIYKKIKANKLEIYTSDYIIDETVTLIKSHSNSDAAINAGNALMRSQLVNIINVDANIFNKTWLNFQKYKDKDYSFTDVSTISIMHELKIIHLFAFDDNLINFGFVKYA